MVHSSQESISELTKKLRGTYVPMLCILLQIETQGHIIFNKNNNFSFSKIKSQLT
jgi:hypothetical protein